MPTKTQLADENARLEAELDLYRIVLQEITSNHAPDAREIVEEAGGLRTELTLWRSIAPHGGIIAAITRTTAGDTIALAINYADSYRARRLITRYTDAIHRLLAEAERRQRNVWRR